MTRPTDAALEAMAVKLDAIHIATGVRSNRDILANLRAQSANAAQREAAAMLRACKTGDAPDARQEGWNAAIEAAAKVARDCIYHDSAGTGFDEDKFDAAIRALKKGPHHD